MGSYNQEFYRALAESSVPSAQIIVPLILELVNPRNVIDVGCGTGEWLSTFQSHGVDEILGIDGDWLDKDQLKIPADRFLAADLTKSIEVKGVFDLVISLEVAEHLPPQTGQTFIKSLTNLGSVILFSAAIPHQNGTGHVNERWPDYWADLFFKEGYVAIDCLRDRVWLNENVKYWYAQNMLIYANLNELHRFPKINEEYRLRRKKVLPIIHPGQYLVKVEELEESLRKTKEAEWRVEQADPINLPMDKLLSVLFAKARNILKTKWKTTYQRLIDAF
jgi:SAM-dependent methyltransferase